VAHIDFAWRGKSYHREITRELFENLIKDIVDRTLGPCRNCLKDAGVTPEQIDEVVLVGGSTRIPMVRSAVEVLFRAKPHTELNPDEVVALGAAVQAGILAGTVENQLLLDVTPLSLGIEISGGVVSKIIHRNSTIPASASETFTTGVDGQTNVLIHVVQGERELAKDCRSLLRFDLKDIAPMPAGMPRIEVRFLIDANGILNVTARDARTGKEQSIDVQPSYGLTLEQTEAMIDEAIEHGEEDLNAAQIALARVDADAILLAIEKAKHNDAWRELGDRDREQILDAIRQLQTVYHGGDHHAIRDKIDVLNDVTHSLAENMMNTAVSSALKGTKV
jgi:molecular chaperone DnaK (HSP70)